MLAAEDDLERAIARHLDGAPAAPRGFAARRDAIELPVNASRLRVLQRRGNGDPTFH
jgi:hypothetical protein